MVEAGVAPLGRAASAKEEGEGQGKVKELGFLGDSKMFLIWGNTLV
jgi:hypothetical protein